MVAVPSKITARVIQQPEYVDADTYGVWKRLNLWRLWDYWIELSPDNNEDTSSEFDDFARTQWDVYCATAEENDEVARVFRTNDEAAAFEAGVPARGEI
jgi:hypothetical protein